MPFLSYFVFLYCFPVTTIFSSSSDLRYEGTGDCEATDSVGPEALKRGTSILYEGPGCRAEPEQYRTQPRIRECTSLIQDDLGWLSLKHLLPRLQIFHTVRISGNCVFPN